MYILFLIAIPVLVFASIGFALYRLVEDALTAKSVEVRSSSVHRTIADETGDYLAESPEPEPDIYTSHTSLSRLGSFTPTNTYLTVAT